MSRAVPKPCGTHGQGRELIDEGAVEQLDEADKARAGNRWARALQLIQVLARPEESVRDKPERKRTGIAGGSTPAQNSERLRVLERGEPKRNEELGTLLHDALVEGIGTGPRGEVHLDLVLSDAPPGGKRVGDAERVKLRFGAVENIKSIEAVLFGRGLKPVGDFVDQVLSLRRTSQGWSLELERAGRVAVHTRKPPQLEREGAG